MSMSLATDFRKDVVRLGAGDLTACMNCGSCTATCALSEGTAAFPRKTIRYLQIGAKGQIEGSLEPWLCYYCGDCSVSCPREANPGETMMAARRWLTARYDWTGLSRWMYRSHWVELGALLAVAAVVLALFLIPSGFGFRALSSHPEALDTVRLDLFASRTFVHIGDLILAFVLSTLLLSNAARMVYLAMRGRRVPIRAWIRPVTEFVVHGLTQRRWRDCDNDDSRFNWLRHILLVSGYGTMFVLVVVFLNPFQVEDTAWHWTSLLGYYATLVLLAASFTILSDRIRKRTQMHAFSHFTDWLFPILLALTSLTGIVLHLLRLMDLAMPTYVAYVIHLCVAVPMLAVEVPFGKWAHLLYRPLAMYLEAVRKRAAAEA
ncbi:MAG: 4Fe-4S dicluster domain-containing protein [Deltaproteobacteria bacterium]|nr:4Fe-4S dicluster domain-containing protein [Deltaproteobacteria bacterium]